MIKEISGLWRRFGAFLIDTIILGIIGFSLGHIFFQQFVEMGSDGRIIGFLIAGVYCVILNSHIGGGQTIGKRVLKIQVVDKNGKLINLPRSALRYSIISIPYFLNGIMIPVNIQYLSIISLVSLLIFGVGLSIVYLFIFNRATRQSLHDIIAGTFVVRKNLESYAAIKPIWPVHYAVCCTIMVLALLAPIFLNTSNQKERIVSLEEMKKQMQTGSQILSVSILEGQTTFYPSDGESKTTHYLSTRIFLNNPKIKNEKLACECAKALINTHSIASEKDIIQVILIYGYDIGIASVWDAHNYSFPPEYWLEKNEHTPKVQKTACPEP